MGAHSWDIVIRVLLAVVCGGLIGLERELRAQPAGLRTHILVSMGACTLTAVSLFGFPDADPARVAASVAAGVGFIGAGAILRSEGGIITGLTTAASLWSCAAVGVLLGTGFFRAGFVVTGIIIVILSLIDWKPELMLTKLKRRSVPVELTGAFGGNTLVDAMEVLERNQCRPEIIRTSSLEGGRKTSVVLMMRTSMRLDMHSLSNILSEIPGIQEVHIG